MLYALHFLVFHERPQVFNINSLYKFVEFLTLSGTSAHVFGPLCDIVFNPYETVRIFSVLYICLFLKWLGVFDKGNIIFMKLGERFFLIREI